MAAEPTDGATAPGEGSAAAKGGVFARVEAGYSFARMEERILTLWDERRVFERSLEKPAPRGSFVFYEGPPTANNMPHPGHVLTRVIKDLLPRFKTMQGHYVRRQGGWDTHGLPVELSVEKELFEAGEMTERGPGAIVKYGLERFNQKCFESVRRYEQEWYRMSSRVGYWLDYENAYFTFTNKYIESVWWLLKQIHDKGLMYKGYKIQWYSTLIGTGLSSHEVAQNWQVVKDPSATVRARIKAGQKIGTHCADDNTYFLLWTTTPWTLLSNVALCVHPDYDYVVVQLENESLDRTEYLVLAEGLLAKNGLEAEEIVARVKGSELVGTQYERLYDYDIPDIRSDGEATSGWRVVADTYVTLEDGTGVVHEAPAFGEDDYRVGLREKLPILNAIDAEGKTLPSVAVAPSTWFKEADPLVLKDLKARGLLYKSEKYEHNYPHCYRTDAPLMSYPLESWFIRMSDPHVKERLTLGNEEIYWQPQHIKHGRFGQWLENVVDWSLSRDRFWGTPLPVWECPSGCQECLGSFEELRERCPDRFEGVSDIHDQSQFNPHRPYIDDYTWPCRNCGEPMQRVRFVIDCWFDAGSMPFAQLHYPFENKELIDGPEEAVEAGGRASAPSTQFPADFISEAVDQTRGWFYTLHAISTLIKERPPYKSCLVLGHILDEKGRKMSKRLGNVVDPWKVINEYGADAFRWYFYSSASLTQGARFADKGVLETLQRFMIPLWNVFSFFTIYANIDGFDPRRLEAQRLPYARLTELDKWILLKFNALAGTVAHALDRLLVTEASRAIEQFVDELSNWYLRRSRRRFWQSENDDAKTAAYQTLYTVLVKLSRLMAPFTPFIAEELYQRLVVEPQSKGLGIRDLGFGQEHPAQHDPLPQSPIPDPQSLPDSVHLCDYPEQDGAFADSELEYAMDQTLRATKLGHSARKESRLRVRQPLARVVLVSREAGLRAALEAHSPILLEELNVKSVEWAEDESEFVSFQYKPNFRLLGPRFGDSARAAAQWIQQHPAEMTAQLEAHRDSPVDVEVLVQEDGEGEFAGDSYAIIEQYNWVEIELNGALVALDERYFEVVLVAHAGMLAQRDGGLLLVLDTQLTDALKQEGLAREVVNRLQQKRKELELEYEARIAVEYSAPDELAAAIEAWADYIKGECLAVSLMRAASAGELAGETAEASIEQMEFAFGLRMQPR